MNTKDKNYILDKLKRMTYNREIYFIKDLLNKAPSSVVN